MTNPAKPTVVSDTQGEPQADAQDGPWKVIEDADFSGSKDYPFMIVLDRPAGPCEPNVVASRMSKSNADLIVSMEAALDHITAYALEAQKTPISREDMHDPMKAQAIFDEHKGLLNLVLSETGK